MNYFAIGTNNEVYNGCNFESLRLGKILHKIIISQI